MCVADLVELERRLEDQQEAFDENRKTRPIYRTDVSTSRPRAATGYFKVTRLNIRATLLRKADDGKGTRPGDETRGVFFSKRLFSIRVYQ